MRTAINIAPRTRSFQMGGVMGLDEEGRPIEPLPVTTAVTPVSDQPAPGSAGVTPPTTPPPPTPPPPTPAQAIEPRPAPPGLTGSGRPIGAPPQEADFERQAEQHLEEAEKQAFAQVRSHRGDDDYWTGQKPKGQTVQDHPEFAKLQELVDIFPQIRDRKNQIEAYKYIDSMTKRLQRETERNNTNSHKEFLAKEKSELAKADGKSFQLLQIPQIDQLITDGITKGYSVANEKIASGTAADRLAAEESLQAAPITTFGKNQDQFINIIKDILSKNATLNLSPDAAAKLAIRLATPPLNNKGLNGHSGRAAANYIPKSVDVLGNRVIETEYGNIRISPKSYESIKEARQLGYNNVMSYRKDLQGKRDAEARPGLVARGIDYLFNR
jgi:hypothetical protein